MDGQTTLRDQIENAIVEHSEPIEASSEDISSSEEAQRERDEAGRFKPSKDLSDVQDQKQNKSEIKSQELQQTGQTTGQQQEQPTSEVVSRPSSWKKEYEQHWGQLAPEVQKYIVQREADYAKGVSMYKQNWENIAPLQSAIQPFMETLQKHNIQPDQWISSLGNAHLSLVNGSPEQKAQIFAKLANDYGVNLQALGSDQPIDHQFSSLAQELNQLKNQWTTFQTTRAQQEQAAVHQEIQNFAAQKPHFDALRETMGSLLQSGMASSLEDAYSKAMRLNDEIWQQEQTKQVQAQAVDQQKVIAEKRAKAVSPKSSSPTGIVATGNSKKSLRETLMDAVNENLG